MPESSDLRTPFGSQCVNGSQTLLKPAQQHLHPNFLLISNKLSPEPSLLHRSVILGLFFNMLMANRMYSRYS